MFFADADDDPPPEEETLLQDADREMQEFYRRKYQTQSVSRVFDAPSDARLQREMSSAAAVPEPSFDRMSTAMLYGDLTNFDRQEHVGAMHFVAQHRDEDQTVSLEPSRLDVIEGDAVVIRCSETTVLRLRHEETGEVLSPTLAENGSLVFTFKAPGRYSSLGSLGSTSTKTGINATDAVPVDAPPALSVTVVPPHTKLRQNIAKIGALAIGGITIAAFVLLAIGLWLESSSLFHYLVGKTDVPSLYGLEKKLENLFYKYSFPWFLVAAVTLIVIFIVRIAMCFRVERVHQFRRGFSPRTHLVMRWVTAAHSVAAIVLVLIAWHMALTSNTGFNDFLATLSSSATATLNMALSAGTSVNALVRELPIVFPGVSFPDSAGGYINETLSIVNSARTWSNHGVDLASGGFRILAVLRFVVFVFTLFAASSNLIGAYFAQGDLIRSGVWFNGIALSACTVGIGASYLLYGIGHQTYDIGVALETRSATEATFTDALGLSDSVVLQVIVQCDQTGILSQAYLNDVTHAIVDEWNRNSPSSEFNLPTNWSILNPQNTKEIILTLVDQIQEVENLLLSSQQYLGDAGRFINQTAPMLNAALTVTRTSAELSDCSFLQTALELSLPKLHDDALTPLMSEIHLSETLMIVLFAGMFISVATSFVIRRPRKIWYCRVTRRWFRFKISYYVHRIVTMRLHHNPVEQRRLNGNPRVQGVSWLSLTGALIFGYLSNHVCSLVQLFIGMMLLILNFSLAANQLPTQLLVVSFASIFPAVIIPLEFQCVKSIPAVPPVALRLAGTVVSGLAVLLTFTYSHEANMRASDCLSKLLDAPDSDGSSAVAPPNPCSPDNVFRDVEMSVYAIVVGIVSALAVVSGIALVFNSSRRLFTNTYKLRPQRILDSLNKIQSMAIFDGATAKKSSKVSRCLIATLVVGICVGVPLVIANELARNETGTPGMLWTAPAVGCNGDVTFCHKRVDELVWATVHNAMSTSTDKFVAPNNFYPIAQALQVGFRAFTIEVTTNGADSTEQTKGTDGHVAMECHGSCRLGGYPMVRDLDDIATFLTTHPNDVVVLFVNQFCHSQDIVAAVNQSNASSLLWTPGGGGVVGPRPQWPTLEALINLGQRLLIFTDAPPGTSVNPGNVPWLPYAYDWIAATNDVNRQLANLSICTPGTGFVVNSSSGRTDGRAVFMNHFVTVPFASATAASQANTADSLAQQFDACQALSGVRPTFVAVDFWSLGETLNFAFTASGGHE